MEYKQEVEYKIVIRGRCDAEKQFEVNKLLDVIFEYTKENRDTGVVNIQKDAGEPSVFEAQERGTLKTLPININLDEKNIKSIAEIVHKEMLQHIEKEIRYKTYVMHLL